MMLLCSLTFLKIIVDVQLECCIDPWATQQCNLPLFRCNPSACLFVVLQIQKEETVEGQHQAPFCRCKAKGNTCSSTCSAVIYLASQLTFSALGGISNDCLQKFVKGRGEWVGIGIREYFNGLKSGESKIFKSLIMCRYSLPLIHQGDKAFRFHLSSTLEIVDLAPTSCPFVLIKC